MIGGPYFRAVLLSAVAFATPARAATTVGTATVTTVRPLSVVKTDDLEFGSLVASTVAGTATINPTTDARSTGGGTIGATGATPSAAHFTAAGLVNAVALISLPGSITLTRVSGTETMTVTAISSNGPTLRLFPASSTIDIAVGGTLGVAANQVAGNYTGTFTVNVLYF
jgi:Domain of unknown function (DUF4402)